MCSEYPFVNKYKEYPTGPYEIILSDFADITAYCGMALVKVCSDCSKLIDSVIRLVKL
jgi:hypothetical protein